MIKTTRYKIWTGMGRSNDWSKVFNSETCNALNEIGYTGKLNGKKTTLWDYIGRLDTPTTSYTLLQTHHDTGDFSEGYDLIVSELDGKDTLIKGNKEMKLKRPEEILAEISAKQEIIVSQLKTRIAEKLEKGYTEEGASVSIWLGVSPSKFTKAVEKRLADDLKVFGWDFHISQSLDTQQDSDVELRVYPLKSGVSK